MSFEIPLFPLATVLFPGMPLPLRLFESRYLRMFDARQNLNPVFGVVLIRSDREIDSHPDIHQIGTMARLHRSLRRPTGVIDIEIIGTDRFLIEDVNWTGELAIATVRTIKPEVVDDESQIQLERITGLFYRYVQGVALLTNRRFTGISADKDVEVASFDFSSRLPLHTWERQRLLEIADVDDRLREVERLVRRELALLIKAGAAGLALNHPGNLFTLN